jgi:opacity protein-like surface antigen
MKKILLLAAMLLVTCMTAFAQDDYAKFELTGTLTVLRADIDILDNETMVGYGIGAQYNVNRWFGIVGEWTATHGESGPYTFTQDGTDYHIPQLDTRVQTMLAGPRLSYRTQHVTVFTHWLLGAATNKLDDDIGEYNYDSYTNWQFAMAVGGGVDVNLSKRFAIRVGQFDWLPVHSELGDVNNNNFYNHVRFQAGGVIKF